VATISATPDATFGVPVRPAPSDAAHTARQPVDPSQDEADLRLVIEEGRTAGSYVYKTVNRVTGEVVAEFPREQLLQLKDDAQYATGAVVNAKA
jgi:flagellar protein FlaG